MGYCFFLSKNYQTGNELSTVVLNVSIRLIDDLDARAQAAAAARLARGCRWPSAAVAAEAKGPKLEAYPQQYPTSQVRC